MSIAKNIETFKQKIPSGVTLVAVSKTKPMEDLKEAYEAGQRIFGENKIQEMTEKWELLPKDIEWHMIGHVQTNKVKYMAPYVHTIHAVDSLKLLKEINKQAEKNNRVIHCFLQLKIASEDSKFGLSEADLREVISNESVAQFQNIKITGLMGMATFTSDENQIIEEFTSLQKVYNTLQREPLPNNVNLQTLSMGMSGDYALAIQCGSNMIRVGSAIFGARG